MIARAFTTYSAEKLDDYVVRIGKCLDMLDDAAMWSRGHEVENSIGNMCLHLSGNVRQWIIATVGQTPDTRDRDSEFAAKDGFTRDELMARLKKTVEEANAVILSLTDARLEERVFVQGYDVSVMEAVYHVVEHFAYHAGQIIFETKRLTHSDLRFFEHLSTAHR